MNLLADFDFTQSNLQDYVDCPYRFYLRYILRIKWPALVVDDAADFELLGQTGARFHRLIQQYLMGIPEDRLGDMAAADPNPDIATWWDGFLGNIPPYLKGKQFVETILTTTLSQHRLLAKYDLILVQDDGGLNVFDWKTSQKRTRKVWLLERVQTRLYRFVLAQAGSNLATVDSVKPEQITMHYWFAPHPDTPIALPYSQDAYDEDGAFFTGLIEQIYHTDKVGFLRTNDLNKCRYCIYRSHCDRGVEAGDLATFEEFNLEAQEVEQDIEFENIAEIEF